MTMKSTEQESTAIRMLKKKNPSTGSNASTSRSRASGTHWQKAVIFEKSNFCELRNATAPFGLLPLGMIHPGTIVFTLISAFCFCVA